MAPQKKKHTKEQLRGLYSSHQLKECPACGEPSFKVIESRRVFDGVRRRYECYKCDYRDTTYEVTSVVYDELRALRNKIATLQQVFADIDYLPKEEVKAEPQTEEPDGIPCADCAHLTPYGCSFDIPEAQTEAATGCNLFQPIISDSMLL